MDPGEVVQRLSNLVVEDKRAVAVVAETAKAKVEPREGGNTPTWRVWSRIRQPNSFTTSRLPLNSCAVLLMSVLYPKRNSFTFAADRTRVLETMYCLDVV